ncbi:MAG: Verru_Chthon cassette protein D [Chthoniobacteraceae bacterium]
MNTAQHPQRARAFSLIELIIVISVIVIIAAFTIPAMNTVLKGSQLSQGANTLVGQLNIARQQALSRNRQVEVRFYRYADPEVPGEDVSKPETGKFRALQLFQVTPQGVALPLDKVLTLPNSVIFSYSETEGLSSLLDKPTAQTPKKPGIADNAAPRLPRGVDYNYDYVSLKFMQDGSTDKSPTGRWFITVIGINDRLESPTKPPPNFFTVQVDPVSGVTKIYRPTAG